MHQFLLSIFFLFAKNKKENVAVIVFLDLRQEYYVNLIFYIFN